VVHSQGCNARAAKPLKISPCILGVTIRPRDITHIQVWSKSDQRRLRETLHIQTNRQTNRHYENNGHLAVNQKDRRLTQSIDLIQLNCWMCTSHFVTFQHRLLQLKCTWSGVSPKHLFRCRRIVDCSFSQPFAMQITFPPQKCPFVWRDLDPHLIRGLAVFARLKIVTDRQTGCTTLFVTIDRIYMVVRCGLIVSCVML